MTPLSPTRMVPAYPVAGVSSLQCRAALPRLAEVAPRARAGRGFFFG